jgi:hypothetical protein
MPHEPGFIRSASGVRVWVDWRSNILINSESAVLARKAALPREQYTVDGRRLCRFGSENSEDALTWNVFRTLEKSGLLSLALCPEIPAWEGKCRLLYWTCDPDTDGSVDSDLQTVLNDMEPWGKNGSRQQTESDVIVLTPTAVVVVESKLGVCGKALNAWKRTKPGLPSDYEAFVRSGSLKLFDRGFVTETQGHRYYQLVRNWILANALGQRLGVPGHLVAIVNDRCRNFDDRPFTEEFSDFQQLLPSDGRSRACLLSWQTLIARLRRPAHPDLAPLLKWLDDLRALRAKM